MKYLAPFGLVLFVFGLYLAFFQHSDIWYSFFLVGGFLFLEGINYSKGFSVLKNIKWFLKTWLIFIVIAVVIEIIGNLWLNLWDYPTFNKLNYLIHLLITGYLNEYPNIYAYEWKYVNWPLGEFLGIPILVSLLWFILLFVLFFKKPFEFRK